MWHRLLCFLRIRKDIEWAPPALGPEVNHPYFKYSAAECCEHCGGGKRHPIHKRPYDSRRLEEVCSLALGKLRKYPGEPLPNPENPAAVKAYIEREH